MPTLIVVVPAPLIAALNAVTSKLSTWSALLSMIATRISFVHVPGFRPATVTFDIVFSSYPNSL